MAKRAKRVGRKTAPAQGVPRPVSEFLGVALFAVALLVSGGLISLQNGSGALMGPVGRMLAIALYASFGMGAYLVALGILMMGIQALRGKGMEVSLGEGVGFTLATLAGCVLLHVMFPHHRLRGYTAGGLTGEFVGEISLGMFHHAGTYLVAGALLCVGLLASTPLSTVHFVVAVRTTAGALLFVGRYLGRTTLMWLRALQQMGVRSQPGATPQVDDDRPYTMGDETYEDEAYEDEYEDEAYEPVAHAGSPVMEAAVVVPPPEAIITPPEAVSKRARTRASNRSASPPKKPSVPGERPLDAPLIVERAGGDGPEHAVAGAGDGTTGAATTGSVAKGRHPGTPAKVSETAAGDSKGQGSGGGKGEGKIRGIIRLTRGPYELPPLHLFEAAGEVSTDFDRGFVLEQAERLVAALAEFKIRGRVTKIHPGPVITRYEFKPEAGVKLSKIGSLENDIAMALEAVRIRILAPIPGKATVGFEVPNKVRETVFIREILAQEKFGEGMKLPLALGKDITGTITNTDLARAPHLLVAGATGSGKSVGINSMICSLLYKCSPEDVRMIMIDPKMLELSIYEGIPHLLLPVVTDAEKSALALRWAVQEMERRYTQLSAAQVRDIAGYNRKVPELVSAWEKEVHQIELVAREASRDAQIEGEKSMLGTELPGMSVDAQGHVVDVFGGAQLPERPERIPYIVVVIDEFADLMMVASKEVEQCVARIAAKARAAGIHLIVATQRPSVDVITGTIKNNFPSRIAFQVTSDADSRTILDGKGAKQLLGMGDMLHMDRGTGAQRVHGCYVSEEEILKVVDFVKRQAKPVFNMDIVRKTDDGPGADADANLDQLYDRAVEIVSEAQKVSTSMLQRRLGVGYNRAAKIVEAMEERGVIGSARGSAPREVFISAV